MLVLQTRKLNLRVTQLLSGGFNLGNVVFESEPLATTLSSLCPEVEGKPCWKLKKLLRTWNCQWPGSTPHSIRTFLFGIYLAGLPCSLRVSKRKWLVWGVLPKDLWLRSRGLQKGMRKQLSGTRSLQGHSSASDTREDLMVYETGSPNTKKCIGW